MLEVFIDAGFAPVVEEEEEEDNVPTTGFTLCSSKSAASLGC